MRATKKKNDELTSFFYTHTHYFKHDATAGCNKDWQHTTNRPEAETEQEFGPRREQRVNQCERLWDCARAGWWQAAK